MIAGAARGPIAIAALSLLLAGCVTSDSRMAGASTHEAARLNTDLGIGYFRQGRLDLALERLERAVGQDPRHAPAHSSLALVYEALDEPARAESHYRTALRLVERDPALQNSYAVFLCRQGRHREAGQYFDRAAADRLYATPEVALTNAGICMRGAGEDARAERYLRDALERNPAYGEALLQLGALSYERGEHLAARAFVQRYLGAAAATPQVLWLAHRVERALGDGNAAREYARRLQQEFPDAAETRELDEA